MKETAQQKLRRFFVKSDYAWNSMQSVI